MYVYNASDIPWCCLFPYSFIGKSLAWYVELPPRSISNFSELGEKFTKQFFAQAIFTTTSDFFLSIRKKPHESARDYTARFNQAS